MFDCDVAVVGAGAAGLLAARELSRAGRSVVVFEARDRTGGRIREEPAARALAPIELGAEFVHGRPKITYALLREIGLTVVDNAQPGFALRDGVLRPMDPDPSTIAGDILALALERAEDETVAATIARAIQHGASREAGDWAMRMVSGFDAADPARASARAIAAEWAGDASAEGNQSRPVAGYAPLVTHLTRSLETPRARLSLRTVVERIAYDQAGVNLDARAPDGHQTIRARYALVTVPLGVLQADAGEEGAIAFDPPLPGATRAAIGALAMGPVVKVVLQFADPFWETLAGGAWRDGAFFACEGPFPTYWTQLPVRATTLVAWAGGPYAERLRGRDEERCIALALEGATRMFGAGSAARDAFETGFVHDWQRDPFARGAYSYALLGGERAHEALAEPVAGRVFFAGEATATRGEVGTVAGALQSGLRAAHALAGA